MIYFPGWKGLPYKREVLFCLQRSSASIHLKIINKVHKFIHTRNKNIHDVPLSTNFKAAVISNINDGNGQKVEVLFKGTAVLVVIIIIII